MSISARRREAEGSRSEGLRTKVLPQARATGNIHIGTMAGKLKGVMPATTPRGWRMDQESMPVPTFSVKSPLRKEGMPVANSTTSKAAGGFAASVGEDFAVLAGEDGGDFFEAGFEDFTELEQDAGAAEGGLGGPGWECGGGGCDGCVDLSVGGEGDVGLDAAGGGMVDVSETVGGAGGGAAGDPVVELLDGGGGGFGLGDGCGGHGIPFAACCGVPYPPPPPLLIGPKVFKGKDLSTKVQSGYRSAVLVLSL